ncbi:hypothetical protein BH11BAC3_BH11BAC3_44670 [soil metagenome]
MTEQQFKYEIKACCKRILNDVFCPEIDDRYIDNINFKYHDESTAWVEYFGTKFKQADKKTLDIVGRIMYAVCKKHKIIFLKYL